MVRASISARVYFPAPCGPARITAWGNRSRASISRSWRTVSGIALEVRKRHAAILNMELSRDAVDLATDGVKICIPVNY